MKKYLIVGFLTLLAPLVSNANGLGEKLLAEVAQNLREMVDYESDIVVEIKGNTIEGHYRVSGNNYHIDMNSVEFWGRGDRRYEVSHKIEEIVIEKVTDGDNMLLNNPSKAFDFVGEGFDAVLEDNEDVVVLTPKHVGQTKMDVDKIIIHIDPQSSLPTKILYEADNDRASILFKGIRKSKSPLGDINLSKYKKYDIVDLY